MLRKIRIGISVVLFALITFYFLDFANILPNSFHRLAHIQFVPAVLSLSIGILIVLIALTLLFGRIYCSTICPMGIWQDVIARISKSVGKKKKRYRYSPAKNMLRWTVLGVTVIASVCGFSVVLGLLDPYSAYGRIVVHIFKPVYMLGNNLLESVFSRFDNYTFYQVDTSVLSLSSLLIAILTFAAILILAWKHGRTWCNTICPVGTVLGFLSRYSLFKVRIDTAKCNGCGLCATKCKAACIHSKEHAIDYSRCVDCFDCLGACKQKALVYAPASKGSFKHLSNQSNLMLFVRFPRLVESGNPYAYHFLRLQTGHCNGKVSHTPYVMESAEKNNNQVTPIYVNSVNSKDRTVELHINPELIFDGDFHTLYEENKNFDFEFILIGIQRNRLIPINSANYLFCNMRLADCKRIFVQIPSITDPGTPISFILIPFPYLDYVGASRIEKVLYNSVSHCNVDIDD